MAIMAPSENHPEQLKAHTSRLSQIPPLAWGFLALAIVAIVVALSFLVPAIPAPKS